MPKSTDYQFSSEEPREERNPYAVLNVNPVIIADLRDQLSTALAALKDTDKSRIAPPDEEEVERHSRIVKLEMELKKLDSTDDTDDVDPKRVQRKKDLEVNLAHYREYLALRNAATPQETNDSDLQGALEFVDLLPEDDEIASGAESLSHAQVEHMGEVFRSSMTSLAETLAHPRKSKKYRDLEKASTTLDEMLGESDAVSELTDEQRQRLNQLSRVLELEENILSIDDDIHGHFRTLAQRFHPDANRHDDSAQERFKEASSAHKKLMEANEEERKAFMMNLVFGQRTELWTNEMRKAAEPIAKQLAPVFALERPLPGETVPCDECNGAGSVVVQEQDDYFPVPVVCEGCEGNGAIFKTTYELRRALESLDEEEWEEEYDDEEYE